MKLLKEFAKANLIIFLVLFIFNLSKIFINVEEILIKFNNVFGIIVSALLGGVFIGNPVISYTIGYKLLREGIHPSIVGAFILSWLTVGILNIPVELKYFGKFSIKKNLIFLALSIMFGVICWLIF